MTTQERLLSWVLSVLFCFLIYVGVVLPDTHAEDTLPQAQENEEKPQFSITHKWRPSDSKVQDYVRYAYKISWGDLDFVATLEAENGKWDMYRQSDVVNWGRREESYWFCQMMKKYHPEVSDKRFWEDPYWQLDVCYSKYKNGTKFYGYNVRNRVKDRFDVWVRDNVSQPREPVYPKARQKQDEADRLWEACILSSECQD